MKQLIGFIILTAVLFGCQKPKEHKPKVIVKTFIIYRDTCDSEFIKKIAYLESGGRDSTVGDGGRAKGRYGAHNIAVTASGLRDLMGYTHDDMFNPDKASHVFWALMGVFSYKYYIKHGKYPTYEDLARMWNGGERGYLKKSTLKYLKYFRKL